MHNARAAVMPEIFRKLLLKFNKYSLFRAIAGNIKLSLAHRKICVYLYRQGVQDTRRRRSLVVGLAAAQCVNLSVEALLAAGQQPPAGYVKRGFAPHLDDGGELLLG